MKKKTTQDDIDELNPYELDKLSKIPVWLVVIFLKYWAAAAAVFFMTIGGIDIGITLSDEGDISYNFGVSFTIILLIALGMAVLFNYGIKQIVFMMHNRRRNAFRYYLIPTRGLSSFLLHLVYMFVVSLILYFLTIFLGSKGWVLNPFNGGNYGIEPFTYGLSFIIVDGIFVSLKDLGIMIYQRVIYKKQMQDNTPIVVGKGA